MSKVHVQLVIGLFAGVLFASAVAAEANYPNRTVRIIVPFAAGGGQDIFMRQAAPLLGSHLGEAVVIENKPGASGVIGANYVKAAKPDGYTLLLGTAATHGMVQAVTRDMSYDAEKDFEPIALVANVPLVLAVNANVGANNTDELVALLRKNPDGHPYASSGTGAPLHLAGELFKKVTGVESTHVPYKGSGPAMTDLVAGRVSFMFDTYAATNPHVKSGRLVRLGVSSAERFSGDPDLPTLKEQGYDVMANSWSGVFVPAGTPSDIQDAIRIAFEKTVQDEELKKKLIEIGFEPNTADLDSQWFRGFIADELVKWQEVVDAANIQKN